jgi:hypothetical protein
MADAQVAACPALGKLTACHHLGYDQPSAMRVGALPERLVGYSRHRRQKHAIADFDSANVERSRQFAQFSHAQKPSIFILCSFSSQNGGNVQRGMTPH